MGQGGGGQGSGELATLHIADGGGMRVWGGRRRSSGGRRTPSRPHGGVGDPCHSLLFGHEKE